jgi:molybdate transport system substrate-binding protein
MTRNSTLTVLLLLVTGCTSESPPSAPLVFYCAAGLKPPVSATIAAYHEETGAVVETQYGGSGTLLSTLQLADAADLYLAADESYIETARKKGLVAESIPVATMRAVIAVPKGNPKGIRTVKDLLRDDVSYAMANPDQAAVGRKVRKLLQETGEWAAVAENVRVYKPTVTEVANDILLGAVDAGLIWDATANFYEKLEGVSVETFERSATKVTVGIAARSKHPTEALKFARYLTGSDRGLVHFAAQGFTPAEGDPWAEHPEVLVHIGAMLRPGIETDIEEFEEREGCSLRTVYNGCGILVAQMKAGDRPDAYVSCDLSFMNDVQDLFLPSHVLTENDMVIVVEKGNPKGITGLQDLTRPGTRLGLAHRENSALGALTYRLGTAQGLMDELESNRVVDSATGDYLMNQIRAGSLDAVIVYRSNAMNHPANLAEHLDLVEIGLPGTTAIQPYAVAKQTPYKQLLARFFDHVLSPASRIRFETVGFRWAGTP